MQKKNKFKTVWNNVVLFWEEKRSTEDPWLLPALWKTLRKLRETPGVTQLSFVKCQPVKLRLAERHTGCLSRLASGWDKISATRSLKEKSWFVAPGYHSWWVGYKQHHLAGESCSVHGAQEAESRAEAGREFKPSSPHFQHSSPPTRLLLSASHLAINL